MARGRSSFGGRRDARGIRRSVPDRDRRAVSPRARRPSSPWRPLQIDAGIDLQVSKTRTFERFGNERNLEPDHPRSRATIRSQHPGDGQGNAFHRDRAAIDEVFTNAHRRLDADPPVVSIVDSNHHADPIDMALNEVPAQQGVERRRPFEVDRCADVEAAERGHLQRPWNHIESMATFPGLDDGQAAPVDRDRCTRIGPVVPPLGVQDQSPTGRRGLDRGDSARRFDESSEHARSLTATTPRRLNDHPEALNPLRRATGCPRHDSEPADGADRTFLHRRREQMPPTPENPERRPRE